MKTVIHSLALASSACLLVAAAPAERELPDVTDDPAPGQAEDELRAEIRTQLEASQRRFQEAYNRHDAQALARLYTEDAILVTAEGRQLRGRSEIATYWEDAFEQTSPRLTIERVEIGGRADLGWAYGTYTVEGAIPEQAGTRPASQRSPQRTIEGHYVVITHHEAGRALIRIQMAHPGAIELLTPEPERPTPPGAGPSRPPGPRPGD